MRHLRRYFHASVLAAFFVLMVVTPTLAQDPGAGATPIAPTPVGEPGYCAPWHRCVAGGIIGALVLYFLATGAMYLYQRRGFTSVEHRQGNPGGVPAGKK